LKTNELILMQIGTCGPRGGGHGIFNFGVRRSKFMDTQTGNMQGDHLSGEWSP